MEIPGLKLDETEGKVFLSVEPSAQRAGLDAADLRAGLEAAGYGACLLHQDALAQALACANANTARAVHLVAERRDARVAVSVAGDAMQALLCVEPPMGGAAATRQAVLDALADAGVVAGVDQEAVAHALGAGLGQEQVVARGAPPQDGHDTVFAALTPVAPDRTPRVDEHGLVDYRAHGGIVMVEPGALLMRRSPATPGVPGYTVRGDELPAQPGCDVPFAASLAGAEKSGDDPDVLCASIAGQPVQVTAGVVVERVLRVAQVDMATGHIDFDGSVQVDGDVGQQMKVSATGDIMVGGTVDGGIVQAGGDVHVAGGVIGHARVQAHGGLQARFAEASQLHAGAVLTVLDTAMDCRLQSLGQIVIGAGSPQRGRLTGGHAQAMMKIRAPLLGTEMGGATRVELGVNPALQARKDELAQRIEKEQKALDGLQRLVAHLSAHGDPKAVLGQARASLEHVRGVLAQLHAQHQDTERELARGRDAVLEVGVAVQGVVDLALGQRRARLRPEPGTCSVRLNADGAVVRTDALGYATPVTAA